MSARAPTTRVVGSIVWCVTRAPACRRSAVAVSFCGAPGVGYVALLTSVLTSDGVSRLNASTLATDGVVRLTAVDANAAPCGAQAASLGVLPEYDGARLFAPQRADGDRGAWFVDVDAAAPTRRSFDADRVGVYGIGPVAFELRDGALRSGRARVPFATNALQPATTTATQAKTGESDTFVGSGFVFARGAALVNCVGDRLELSSERRAPLFRRCVRSDADRTQRRAASCCATPAAV